MVSCTTAVLLPDRAPAERAAAGRGRCRSRRFRDPRGAFARLDLTGMGSYYYDLPPNPTTSARLRLVN